MAIQIDLASLGDSGARLLGGAAGDTLTGGDGIDAFVFAVLQGADTITDFADGTDVISMVGVANFAALSITDTANGARIVFEDTPTTSITLTGVAAAQLSADDFFFS
ncbi:MAG: hypothetical protein RIM84_24980 [Alphaproteobacteria bacterium]